jgi:hypothetical protein
MSVLNNKPRNNRAQAMCHCGKPNCPNPGNRDTSSRPSGLTEFQKQAMIQRHAAYTNAEDARY